MSPEQKLLPFEPRPKGKKLADWLPLKSPLSPANKAKLKDWSPMVVPPNELERGKYKPSETDQEEERQEISRERLEAAKDVLEALREEDFVEMSALHEHEGCECKTENNTLHANLRRTFSDVSIDLIQDPACSREFRIKVVSGDDSSLGGLWSVLNHKFEERGLRIVAAEVSDAQQKFIEGFLVKLTRLGKPEDKEKKAEFLGGIVKEIGSRLLADVNSRPSKRKVQVNIRQSPKDPFLFYVCSLDKYKIKSTEFDRFAFFLDSLGGELSPYNIEIMEESRGAMRDI